MASIINASNTGFGGIVSTGDSSGQLQLQTAGTAAVTIDTSQHVSIGGTTVTDVHLLNIQGPTTTNNIGVVLNDTTNSRIWAIDNGANTLKFFDYTANALRMSIDSSGNLLFNSGYGSAATAYGCRAWVNFNGTTSPGTITASGNVTSVTKNAAGDYTVNFTNAMPDANYVASITGTVDVSSTSYQYCAGVRASNGTVTTKTTSAVRIISASPLGSSVDSQNMSVAIFR